MTTDKPLTTTKTAHQQHAIIIGAGAAGLASAALLAQEGLKVTVVEQNSEIGGRSGSLTVPDFDGFRWDTGPSWYLMPDAFDHFFELLGTTTAEELDLVELNDPAYRLFPEGEDTLDVRSGVDNIARTFESIEPGAGVRIRDYLAAAGTSYRLALKWFLYTTFSSFRPIKDAELRGQIKQLGRLLKTSLKSFVQEQFTDSRLRQLLTYPAVFLSTRPEKTPALYHLMSHTDMVQGVRYPLGGFTAVMEAFYRLAVKSGAEFRLNTQVLGITTKELPRKSSQPIRRHTATATGVRVLDDNGTVTEISADIVVSAADLHHTENHLLPAALRSYPESWFSSRDPGLGTVLVMAGVNGKLPQLSHHNLIFSKDWSADFDAVFDPPSDERPTGASRSIYISMPSASDPSVAPDDQENLFILIPVAAAPEIGHGNAYREPASPAVTEIANEAIDLIAQRTGIQNLKQRIVVMRTLGPADFAERYNSWSGGGIGPGHSLKQSAFLRGRNVSKKVSNLFYAGATTVPGVGIPMCLISAENVIKRLRGDTSPSPLKPGGEQL